MAILRSTRIVCCDSLVSFENLLTANLNCHELFFIIINGVPGMRCSAQNVWHCDHKLDLDTLYTAPFSSLLSLPRVPCRSCMCR